MNKKVIENLTEFTSAIQSECVTILIFTKRQHPLYNKIEKKAWESFKRKLLSIGFSKEKHLGQVYAYLTLKENLSKILKEVEEILPPGAGVDVKITQQHGSRLIGL